MIKSAIYMVHVNVKLLDVLFVLTTDVLFIDILKTLS